MFVTIRGREKLWRALLDSNTAGTCGRNIWTTTSEACDTTTISRIATEEVDWLVLAPPQPQQLQQFQQQQQRPPVNGYGNSHEYKPLNPIGFSRSQHHAPPAFQSRLLTPSAVVLQNIVLFRYLELYCKFKQSFTCNFVPYIAIVLYKYHIKQ